MKNILNEIYYSLDESINSERFYFNQAEDKLLKTLKSKQKGVFEAYKEMQDNLILKDDREAFKRGFRACLQLLFEAMN
jgi:hypothetical protein